MQPTRDDEPVRLFITKYRHLIVLALGLFALAGGISSFLGYLLDIPRLTDWDGNGISIQPNATLCAAFSGLALMLLAASRRRLAAVCAVVVGLIGGSTLLEWITGVSFGHDTWLLFGRQWGRLGVVHTGRMGPPGSLSWTLIGASLLLSALATKVRWQRLAPALALLTVLISSISLAGYLYGAQPLFTIPTLSVVAMQTALFIMAVSLGIIASHPDREPMRMLIDPGGAGIFARRLVPVLFAVAIGLGFLRVVSHTTGLLDIGSGVAIHALAMIALLAIPLWWALAALREREQALSQALADAQLLHRLTKNLAKPCDPKELYDMLMDAAVEIMHADFSSLQMLHPNRGGAAGELELLAHHGFTPQAAEFWKWVRADSNCTARPSKPANVATYQTGLTTVASAVRTSSRFNKPEFARCRLRRCFRATVACWVLYRRIGKSHEIQRQ